MCAKQVVVVGAGCAGLSATYTLRPEIQRIPDEALPYLPPDQLVYVMYITRIDKYDPVTTFTDINLTPIHAITKEGVSLLKIVRTDAGTLAQGTSN